jgi:tRNA isopentenyl-2-thiomethyl-A-37 hydroxylase MiaE
MVAVSSLVERLLFGDEKPEAVSVLKCYQRIYRMKNYHFYRDLMESEAGHYTTLLRMRENTVELMSKTLARMD